MATDLRPTNLVRAAIAAVMLSAAVATPGCYGSFPLTGVLYKANGQASDSTVVHSILMLVLVIIPVYQVCMIVDGLILNSVEYWNGSELVLSKSEDLPDGSRMTLAPGRHGNEATLTQTRDGVVILQRTFLRVEPTRILILDETGAIVGIVNRSEDGGLTFAADGGRSVASYSPTQLAAFGVRAPN